MTEAQAALVRQHLPLVSTIAWPLKLRTARYLDTDDLLQAGRLGLCEAAERWRADRGVPFTAYARLRIHGAMIDALRTCQLISGVPRTDLAAAPVAQWSVLAAAGFDVPGTVDLDTAVDVAALVAAVPDVRQRFALRAWAAGWSHRAIGAAMGRSESRAHQLHGDGLDAMRRRVSQAAGGGSASATAARAVATARQ